MSARRLVAIGLLCLAILAIAVPASAHTALVSSTPADDATVDEAVRQVVLTFTEPIELAGTGAQVLDATGTPVDADVTVDGPDIVIRPAEPLTGGVHGVRWAVRSGDAHPVRGTIRFTVDAVIADTEANARREHDAKGADTQGDMRPDPGVPRADVARSAPGVTAAAYDGARTAHRGTALTRALASDATRPLEALDTVLRAVFYAVTLGAMGVAAFLLGAWDGSRREVRLLCRTVVRLAAASAIVVVAQLLVRSALTGGGWNTALASLSQTLVPAFATGTALRLAGALLLIAGTPLVRRHLLAARPIAGAAVDIHLRGTVRPLPVATTSNLGARVRPGAIMLLGVFAIASSFALVGHAATAEPRLLSATAAVAHVLAASVWGGGLLALVTVLTHRRRHSTLLGTGLVEARFSVLATGGVLLAAAAGIGLALVRLDAVAELWTTRYGHALLAKVAIVTVVAAIGAYNHFAVVPVLRRTPDHGMASRLRRLGLIEVGLLLGVVALTSTLVTLAG